MFLLVVYVLVALGFSFLCSIMEAVLLSVTPSYVSLMKEQGRQRSATLLANLKDDINTPLAAILTLNTIAHTAGAAGAGAQAAAVFGDQFVGLISAVLTLLILVFSEIIPKTIGAHYWRQLAPATAYLLRYLVLVLFPFVKMSNMITRSLATSPTLKGFNREEFAAMAELSTREGQLAQQEKRIIKNLLTLDQKRVRDTVTPRTVVFTLKDTSTVRDFWSEHGQEVFSRIPLYEDHPENICGFVLRTDLLLAHARGEETTLVKTFMRPIRAIPDSLSLAKAFSLFLTTRDHIMLVIDEHGGFEGILTLEDVIEKIIGVDIVDEGDKTPNMRRFAKSRWLSRRKELKKASDDT